MASAVTRELVITYGGFSVGGSTEYEITGPIQLHQTFESASLSFAILVRGDTASAFKTACDAVVAAFRARDVAFTVTYEGQTHLSLNPTTNTGYNTSATVAKAGDAAADTGRSRLYNVTIVGTYPAEDLDGRRDSRISISLDASRRMTISYSGTWTADGSNGAVAAYLAGSPSWMAAQNGIFGAGRTLELVDENYEPDRNNKELSFRAVWRQIAYAQSAASLDHAAVVDHSFRIRVNKPFPGDSGSGIIRLREVTVQFACAVDMSQTQDLDALWADTLLPYIDAQVTAETGASQIARVDEDADFDATANRITASVHYRCVVGATGVIESRVTVGYDEQSGIDFTGVWTSDPLAHYADVGPATQLRVVQRRVVTLGGAEPKSRIGGGGSMVGASFGQQGEGPNPSYSSSGTSLGTGGGGLQPEAGGGGTNPEGWNLVSNRSHATTLWIGPQDVGFAIGTLEETVVERNITRPRSGGARGRGGLRPGPGGSLTGFHGPRR